MGMGSVVMGIASLAASVAGNVINSNAQRKAQNRALQAQKNAARRAETLQQQESARNQARQEQARNQANNEQIQAAGSIDKDGMGNTSNLTGGAGVNPDDLLLGGVPSLLGSGKQGNDDLL